MSSRLYYDDSYLGRFHATAEAGAGDPTLVYLDRTAFYPTSGGQPHDLGRLGEAQVVEVSEESEDGRIAHRVDRAVEPGWVQCEIDWPRRFDHMRQHTGQHLLSAVLTDCFALPTVSFHLGAEVSTIDLDVAKLKGDPARVLADAERAANDVIAGNHPVRVSYHEGREGLRLRKPSDRDGVLRVVTIEDVDQSACGGTHVASTGEVGAVLLRKTDKTRGNLRVEFLCGERAVRQARADYDALTAVARHFSSPLEQTPALVASLGERLAEAERMNRKLTLELAVIRGRELHAATAPNARGVRVVIRETAAAPGDDVRAEAQAFVGAGGAAVFLAACAGEPSAVLLATSPDAPLQAGPALRVALQAGGGRGGGNAALAQGSVPNAEALVRLRQSLEKQWAGE
ncbi:MAG: alanyl-tRNA editing protein [Acidobacteria bacterium]|nr:alanyl-tRNA editing protein [Acidobacteriota bacterium]